MVALREQRDSFDRRVVAGRASAGRWAVRVSLIALFVGAFLVGSITLAQDWAKAMFDHTSHDFGTVGRGAKAEHCFSLENIYLEDAHIASVRSSCGCSTPTVSKRTLKTYETSEVKVAMNTEAFLGRKDAVITVVFDKPFPAEVTLKVHTYIRSDVVLQPGSVQFGSVSQGASVRKKIGVSYAGRHDWRIKDVESNNPHLEVQAIETSREHGRVSYDLWVQLKADTPDGYINDHITLITDDPDPNKSRVTLVVEGVVVPAVAVRPSPLMLGILQTGQTVTRQLVIHGKTPFKVVGVTSADKRLAFVVPKTAKTLHLVPVTFIAGNEPGKVTLRIRIQTDLPETPVLDVTVNAQVVPHGPAKPDNRLSGSLVVPVSWSGPGR